MLAYRQSLEHTACLVAILLEAPVCWIVKRMPESFRTHCALSKANVREFPCFQSRPLIVLLMYKQACCPLQRHVRSSPEMASTFKYRSVPFGKGGTFTFEPPRPHGSNESRERIPHLHITSKPSFDSTTESPIAIHFTIDQNRCFAASISAHIGEVARIYFDQRVRKDPAEKLMRCVKKALDEECAASGWQIADNPLFGTNFMATCLTPKDREPQAVYRGLDDPASPVKESKPGDVVAEAVFQWLHGKFLEQRSTVEHSMLAGKAKALKRGFKRGEGMLVRHGEGGKLVKEAELSDEGAVLEEGNEWVWVWDKDETNSRWIGRVMSD